MNIYEIKKELNGDKAIKELKKNYKKITSDTVKIVIKETKYEQLTLVELGLEYWQDGNKQDFNPVYSYYQTNGVSLKFIDSTIYNDIKEQIKKTIFNETGYDYLTPNDYDNLKGAFVFYKYNHLEEEWEEYYNKCDGNGWTK